MLNNVLLTLAILSFAYLDVSGQNYPWDRPLRMAWSADGKSFGNSEIYQDSSGVPSVIKWKGDTLICAFQWFRQPINSPSWDRVAVKFSYDNGLTWTSPTPIIVNGLPGTYQRPFDPTLTVFNTDSIRIYYSCSDGIPKMGVDTMINTYSAKSADGIHYTFEPNPRVDEPANRVIDPAVIHFKNIWHYIAPVGSPQQGAYHYISPDGLNYSKVPNIPSDNMHNWTGNFMVKDTNELRFYGSGPFIWYNTSSNAGAWNGIINTNVLGGDPSVVKIADDKYLMIFVGNPYPTGVHNNMDEKNNVQLFPNPASSTIFITPWEQKGDYNYQVFSSLGNFSGEGKSKNSLIDVGNLIPGFYFLKLQPINDSRNTLILKFIKD